MKSNGIADATKRSQICLWPTRRLKLAASVIVSNVDKHLIDGEPDVLLCNYTDVYKNDEITSDIEFMSSSASQEELDRFLLKPGDIVITKDSETADDIGVPAFVQSVVPNLVCGYHLAIIRPKNKSVLPKYLFRVFQSKLTASYFENAATGITRFGLSQYSIRNVLIPMPPFDEQIVISRFIEKEVEETQRLVKKYEHLLDVLSQKRLALVANAVTHGIIPGTETKRSGLEFLDGIPRHWQMRRVKSLFKLVADSSPGSHGMQLLSLYTEIGVRPRSELEQRGNRASNTDGYWLVRKNDIIVNKLLAWMGAIAISHYDGVTSPAYDILRAATDLNPQYYDYLFRCGIYLGEFRNRSRGIMDMRLRLYFDQLGCIIVPYPPKQEQDDIVLYLDAELRKLDAIADRIRKCIALLIERRTSMITAAVSGQIDVREYKRTRVHSEDLF